jgi:hypothetical protein
VNDSSVGESAAREALVAHGVTGTIEFVERIVVITASASELSALAEPARRAELLDVARAHGFTHVAVEVAGDIDVRG